jgi:hypothetical protein
VRRYSCDSQRGNPLAAFFISGPQEMQSLTAVNAAQGEALGLLRSR